MARSTLVSDGSRWEVESSRDVSRGPPVVGGEGGTGAKRARSRNKAEHPSHLINVNTASQKELESLPGVGPVIARRIIEARPYRTVEDLLRVRGLGAKRMEEIRPLVGLK